MNLADFVLRYGMGGVMIVKILKIRALKNRPPFKRIFYVKNLLTITVCFVLDRLILRAIKKGRAFNHSP